MRAVILKAINDLRRRRLQAAVLFATALISVGTATMALTLLFQSRDPYRSAFDAQRGAHLQVAYDGRVDPVTISSTPALVGASESGGPYPATDVQFEFRAHKLSVTAVGRDNPGGQVGQLRLTAGHWPASDHEIALTRSFVELNHISVGDTVRVVSVPQQPQLTVAAEVVDIDEADAGSFAQHAWMLSSAMPVVSRRDASYSYIDYRFSSDPTSAQLQADVNRLRASLPQGSISNSTDYLAVKRDYNTLDPALTDTDAMRILNAEPQTGTVVGELDQNVVVPGISDPIKARIFRGDRSHLGFVLVSGRWFERPGEVVAPRKFIHDEHLSVGDHFTVTVGSKPVSLALVGELFDVGNFGYTLSTDAATMSRVEPDAAPTTYLITVRQGSNVDDDRRPARARSHGGGDAVDRGELW